MVRYAVIGTSWITDAFIAAAAQRLPGRLVLSAVYSRREETGLAFAQKYGVRQVYTSLEELANSQEIDAVYIASPNAHHYPQARLMLEGGKHVLCEKTCVVTSAQLEELLAMAGQRNLVFLEAIKAMHLPGLERVREALSLVGRVHLARFDFSRYSSKYPAYLRGESPNIFNPKLAAGCLMDMGVYSVYPAVSLFGEPLRVDAQAVFLRTGADGAGAALLGYSDKTVALTYSKMSDSGLPSTIQGDEGVLSIRVLEHLDGVEFTPSASQERRSIFTRDQEEPAMGGEAWDFWRCITSPGESREDYERFTQTTRAVIRTMERIRESAGIRFD